MVKVQQKIRATRNAAQTKKAILRAAKEEFSQYGFTGARVDRIAEKYGANKAMIYHYFKSKEGLYRALLEKTYADIRQAESELKITGREPREAIRTLVVFTWDYFVENPDFIAMLNIENLMHGKHIKTLANARLLNAPLIEQLEMVLSSGGDIGLFRKDINPLQLYMSIAALCYFYFSNIHTLSEAFSRDLRTKDAQSERLEHVVDMVLRYVAA